MHTRLDKIKQHVKDNKVIYIVGAAGVAAGATIAIVVLRRNPTEASVITDAFKFQWKSPTTNNVTVTLTPRGELGNPVRNLRTGQIWASQAHAAVENGGSPSAMSRHLSGFLDNFNGDKYERLSWNDAS